MSRSWPADQLRELKDATTPSMRREYVREVFHILQSQSSCSIRDLARRLNLSHWHLKHLFKRQTGVSLGRVLIERRMQEAGKLLARSRMSTKEIAYTLGYKHSSSFIRAFERHFTCTPQAYRREMRRAEG